MHILSQLHCTVNQQTVTNSWANFPYFIRIDIKLHGKMLLYNAKYNNTAAPSTMRYQPNTLKSCFLIYPIRNRITKTDTKNATTIPTSKMTSSLLVNVPPNLTSFKRLAPSITGIAKKNVNSAATVRDTPISSAPTIVAPERDVPGKTAAKS